MTHNAYIYIFVMAAVTYLIRSLPLILIRREIRHPFLLSFLYYVPYTTMAILIFPAILESTASFWSGLAGLAAAVLVAWTKNNLIYVSLAACGAVFVTELFLA